MNLFMKYRTDEPRTLEQLQSDLKMWKGELEYSYRRENKVAPSWLYEKIHRLEEQIKWLKKERANDVQEKEKE